MDVGLVEVGLLEVGLAENGLGVVLGESVAGYGAAQTHEKPPPSFVNKNVAATSNV